MQIIKQTNSVVAKATINGREVEFRYEYANGEAPNLINFQVIENGQTRLLGNYDVAANRTNSTSMLYSDGDGALIDAIVAECKTITDVEE